MKSLLPEKVHSIQIEKLFILERSGRYEEALSKFGDIWIDKNSLPQVARFEPGYAAEILLRSGSLIGFDGHNRQIPESQEISKNLLSEAHRRLVDLEDSEKISECENYLALAYWRAGELVEADVWIEESFSRMLPNTSFTRLYSYTSKSVLLLHDNKNQEIIDLLNELETPFLNFGDDCLKGDFYNYLGMALTTVNRLSDALSKLKLAKHFHTLSVHQFYLETVENNIAYLYKSQGLFREAHEAADNAAELFRKLEDKTREAHSLDTKSQIFYEKVSQMFADH
jgi:tetratricopeptide (TPR) repeat protein